MGFQGKGGNLRRNKYELNLLQKKSYRNLIPVKTYINRTIMPLLATLSYKIKRSGSGMDYLFWDHGLVRYQISVHIAS